jgi:site-specific DNA-methyltransferase (adenine-specific)
MNICIEQLIIKIMKKINTSGCNSTESNKTEVQLNEEQNGLHDPITSCNSSPEYGIKRYDIDLKSKWVKISEITVPSIHSQVYNSKGQLDSALVESIRQKGILNPLLISQNYTIISGVNRYRIAQYLGINEVPAIFVKTECVEEIDIVNSNIQRVKKLSELYKEYKIIKKVMNISRGMRSDIKGNGNKKIESILGISRSTISRLIKIERLATKLYDGNIHNINKVWEMVDCSKYGVTGTLKYLKNKLRVEENTNQNQIDIKGNGFNIYNKCSSKMEELKDNSVDLHICSPPYYGGIRSYCLGENELGWEATGTEYIDKLCQHFQDTKRVLKETGSLVVNISETKDKKTKDLELIPMRFAIKMKEKGWRLSGMYIWLKPNPRPIPGIGFNTMNVFEYLFHFTKSDVYKFNRDWLKNEKDSSLTKHIFGNISNGKNLKDIIDLRENSSEGIVNIPVANNSILKNECRKNGIELDHSATFPITIPLIFISLLTEIGDLVIDGFNGTGTTCAAGLKLSRNYVGYELNKNYIRTTETRMNLIKNEINNAA